MMADRRGLVTCICCGPMAVANELAPGELPPPAFDPGAVRPVACFPVELACGHRRWAPAYLRQGWRWRLPKPEERPAIVVVGPDGIEYPREGN